MTLRQQTMHSFCGPSTSLDDDAHKNNKTTVKRRRQLTSTKTEFIGRLSRNKTTISSFSSFLFSTLILVKCLTAVGEVAAKPQRNGFNHHFSSAPSSDEYIVHNKLNPKCVPITIDMCTSFPYNMTLYPNVLKHSKQDEAEADIKQYDMLVKVQCSPDFQFFLCTLFAPVCTILNEPLPPCKQLCLSAKNGCEALMRKFGYSWPEIFNCDKFPPLSSGMCVGENRAESDEVDKDDVDGKSDATVLLREYECPHTMKVISRARHSLSIANTSIEHCSLSCQNDGLVPIFFSVETRHYLRLWTGAWAVACCVCTFFTIITFLIDLDRFEFPERAILHMAICYFVVSICYMTGLVAEDSLSCSAHSVTKQPLVSQGVDNFACVTMGTVHYFFTTAGMLWWLVLCFSWFLVTTLKWGEAPVAQVFGTAFNIFAWLLPAVGAVTMLGLGNIDGDIFTGVCSVGNLHSAMLFHYVVVPRSAIIGIGLFFFLIGFISILRIRAYIRRQRFVSKFETVEATEKVGRLMLRISSFSLIYIVPVALGTYSDYYQSQNMDNWLTSWYVTRCLHAQRSIFGFTLSRSHCPVSGDEALLDRATPDPTFFFLKYLAHFTIGIACAFWTVNGKTVLSYGNFCGRIFYGGRSRVPTRSH